MTQRIEKLVESVLGGSRVLRLKDDNVKAALATTADEGEILRIIKDEYTKNIKPDGYSLLAGFYPTLRFAERRKTDSAPWEFNVKYERHRIFRETFYFRGGNHYCVDFEKIISRGISDYLERITEKMKSTSDIEKREFLKDLHFAAEAIIAYAEAYANAYSLAAENEPDDNRRHELIEIAEICRRVPKLPASGFREAIQSYYFAFTLFPDGLGRIDQYLYPYYKADIESGVLTHEDALELTEELFIKIFAFLGKDDPRSGEHHGVIAGYTQDGECGHNEYTSLILNALTELPLWRPQISYRVTAKTTAEQMREAVEANYIRPDLVMFLNDEKIIKGLVSVGADPADAINYSSSGCNETMLTGCSHMGSLEGHLNLMHSLELLMNDSKRLEKISDFEGFYKAFEEYLRRDLDTIFRFSYIRSYDCAHWLQPVESLLTEGCIDSATSISRGGAKYNYCNWCLTGIINLADSLSVIKQTVFEENNFSLLSLAQMLRANWEGYDNARTYILKRGRFFGNNDDYADLLINKISGSVDRIASEYTPYRGGRYLFGTLTGYELTHIRFAKDTGASADGRYASTPFAASISTYPGAMKKDVTAFLKSAAKIDENLLQASVVVNLKLDRKIADTPEMREKLTALLLAYFRMGGIQLQINYTSADELIRAQENPMDYRNLRVRVTGFSGFFTKFDKELQDELIRRSLYEG